MMTLRARSRLAKALYGLVLAVLLSLAHPAASDAPPTNVRLRGGVHEKFERLVFDWPRRVEYQVSREQNHVTVKFEARGQISNVTPATRRLKHAHDYSQSMGAGQTSFAFVTTSAAQIRDGRSGNSIIIDIMKVAEKPIVPTKALSASEKTSKKVKTPTATKPTARPAQVAFLVLPSLQPIKTQPSVKVAAPAPAPEKAQTQPPADQILDVAAGAPDEYSQSRITLPAPGQPPLLVLQLNPGMPAALAAYARGGYGYIIFDRSLSIAPEKLIAGQNPLLDLQPLRLSRATGFRFPLPSHADIRVNRSDNTWLIYLAGEKRRVPLTLSFVSEPDYALGPRLLLPVVNPSEPIHFQDPVIGDVLSIIPMLRPGDAMTSQRNYADLTVLVSAQGLVIRHLNDRLGVRKVANGIEVAAGEGLRLSPTSDTGVIEKSDDNKRAGKKNLLFDFKRWRGLKGEDFTDARQRMLQNVIDVPPYERDRVRIELARLYFAYGFGAEAWGLLDEMGRKLPDLFARPEFKALHGAARVLAGDADGGLIDLAMPELQEASDLPLWQALALAQKRDYVAAAPKFDETIHLISDMPEPIFARFTTMALETMVATQQFQKADQWLEDWRLSKEHDAFLESPPVEYLHGVILHGTGNAELAAKAWRRAANSKDKLYRTRAELALIDYEVIKGKLTAASAAQKLEGMRFIWRGDFLEWEILHRLSLYYFQAKKFQDGFTNFGRADRLFPNAPGHENFRKDVRKKFRDIFITDIGSSLTPLEALALYQDYHDLITEESDAKPIIRALTERLIAVDLLEQAAQLLEDLLPATMGADRAQLGARLAGVYLLDHQPQKSLKALEASRVDNMNPGLIEERQLLHARALLETGKADEAKAELMNRGDPPAQLLLGDIAWRNARWKEAASLFSQALGNPPPAGTPLTGEQAAIAVKAATALALAGDQENLDKLGKNYSAAMKSATQKEIFELLTQPKSSGNIRDVASAAMKAGDIDLFRKFLDRYRNPSADARPSK